MVNPSPPETILPILEEDIIFGRLRPRERLVEDDIMKRFGVKRHVVRQALMRLESMGLVTRAPNKGALVRDFSLHELDQIYEMRELLQERAVERIPLPAQPELTSELRRIQAWRTTCRGHRQAPGMIGSDLEC